MEDVLTSQLPSVLLAGNLNDFTRVEGRVKTITYPCTTDLASFLPVRLKLERE